VELVDLVLFDGEEEMEVEVDFVRRLLRRSITAGSDFFFSVMLMLESSGSGRGDDDDVDDDDIDDLAMAWMW